MGERPRLPVSPYGHVHLLSHREAPVAEDRQVGNRRVVDRDHEISELDSGYVGGGVEGWGVRDDAHDSRSLRGGHHRRDREYQEEYARDADDEVYPGARSEDPQGVPAPGLLQLLVVYLHERPDGQGAQQQDASRLDWEPQAPRDYPVRGLVDDHRDDDGEPDAQRQVGVDPREQEVGQGRYGPDRRRQRRADGGEIQRHELDYEVERNSARDGHQVEKKPREGLAYPPPSKLVHQAEPALGPQHEEHCPARDGLVLLGVGVEGVGQGWSLYFRRP